jgi:hypothetical protein
VVRDNGTRAGMLLVVCSVLHREEGERKERGSGGGRMEREMGWWLLGFERKDKGEGSM